MSEPDRLESLRRTEATRFTPGIAGTHTHRAGEYHAAPVTVVSSPVVDAAVIEGRSRGYVDGLKSAQDHADALEATRSAEHAALLEVTRARTADSVSALTSAAAQLNAAMAATVDRAEDTVFDLACGVAELILGAELSDASVAARTAIRRALTETTPSPVQSIRLHPDTARAAAEAQLAPAGVVLVPDAGMRPGEAVAEYRDGWLEAGLEDAMERVRRHAADVRAGVAE